MCVYLLCYTVLSHSAFNGLFRFLSPFWARVLKGKPVKVIGADFASRINATQPNYVRLLLLLILFQNFRRAFGLVIQ